MRLIKITNLGFAAYLKLLSEEGNNIKFTTFSESGSFGFEIEDEMSEEQLKIDYLNSRCARHDRCVMEMRNLITR